MENLIYEVKDKVGYLTFSREKALNALNSQTLDELEKVLTDIESNKNIRALVVTGAGKAFVAGADIKEINELNKDTALSFAKKGQEVFSRLESLYCPTIAAVNGFALGGGLEVALSCDMIFSSEKAKLGLPECTLGLIPGFGGTVRLSRKLSPNLALEMSLSGDMYTAAQGKEMGFVNRSFAPEALMENVETYVNTLKKRSPQALFHIKQSVQKTYGLSREEAMTVERELFAELFGTDNQKEGTQAFIEKRSPNFKDL